MEHINALKGRKSTRKPMDEGMEALANAFDTISPQSPLAVLGQGLLVERVASSGARGCRIFNKGSDGIRTHSFLLSSARR